MSRRTTRCRANSMTPLQQLHPWHKVLKPQACRSPFLCLACHWVGWFPVSRVTFSQTKIASTDALSHFYRVSLLCCLPFRRCLGRRLHKSDSLLRIRLHTRNGLLRSFADLSFDRTKALSQSIHQIDDLASRRLRSFILWNRQMLQLRFDQLLHRHLVPIDKL